LRIKLPTYGFGGYIETIALSKRMTLGLSSGEVGTDPSRIYLELLGRRQNDC
jgi:hypothetical protein